MRLILLSSLALLGLSGCCSHKHKSMTPVEEATFLVETCYQAIDGLLEQHPKPNDIDRVLVSTVVDINNVNQTTMFGRTISEFLSSRLTQTDKDVIHATVRADAMVVRQEGQFLLSREVRSLAMDYNARTALVSTYAVTDHSVILSLKLVSTVEDSTLAGVDVVLARTGTISELLGTSGSTGY